MNRTLYAFLASATILSLSSRLDAQPLGTPELFQPRSTQKVFVPSPDNTAVNFDWSDVPDATGYRFQITRQGGVPMETATGRSELVFSPLTTGAPGSPIQYTWSVTVLQNETEGPTSNIQSFGLEQGTVTPFGEIPGGLASPEAITIDPDHPTLPRVNNQGLFMTWSPVVGAAGYEAQVVLEKGLNGGSFNFLQYRLQVSQPQAYIANLAFPGKYRLDVRPIESGGGAGNPGKGSFYVVESFLDVTGDLQLDTRDLLALASQWRQNSAAPPNGGDVIQDGSVNHKDLTALMIRLRDSTLPLPANKTDQAETSDTGDTASSFLRDSKGQAEAPSSHRQNVNRTGWLQKTAHFLLGAPACAGTLPEAEKQTDSSVSIPRILFPNCEQCIAPTAFQVVWTEVPGATSYAVEVILRFQSGNIQYLHLTTEDSREGNLGIILDDQVGDGVVTGSANFTLPNVLHTIRVQARMGEKRGEFSRKTLFQVSSNCPPRIQFPFIDLDFDGDRDFRGGDFLAYAASWYSATGESPIYESKFDLSPSGAPDGKVDLRDLHEYIALFRTRCFRPKSKPLGQALLTNPVSGAVFLNPQLDSFSIEFKWIPPLSPGVAKPSIYEFEIVRQEMIPQPPTRFFSQKPLLKIPITVTGTYFWRVRTIADDGTLGAYSEIYSFSTTTPTSEVKEPGLIEPVPNASFQAGNLVRFTWTREVGPVPKTCRFDRLEIHNGNIFSVSLDIYHKQSEKGLENVSVDLPLFPNFGPNFRWRIVPYQEQTDNKPELFQLSGEETGFRQFTIQRPSGSDPNIVSGIGAFSSDFNRDGLYGLEDFAPLSRTHLHSRGTSVTFDPNYDFDFDGKVEASELLQILDIRKGVGGLQSTGALPPIQIGPRSVPGMGLQLERFTKPGVIATWFPVDAGVVRYFVEWIDYQGSFRGHFAEKLDTPNVVFPANGQEVTLNSPDEAINFTWQGIPDTQEYDLRIVNINNGATHFWDVPPPEDPFSPTASKSLTASVLIRQVTPDQDGTATYRVDVFPEACAHFVDFVPSIEFKAIFNFPFKKVNEEAVKKDEEEQRAEKVNLPILLTGSARVYSVQPGLYHWRVTPVNAEGRLGIPSLWQTYGVPPTGPPYNLTK